MKDELKNGGNRTHRKGSGRVFPWKPVTAVLLAFVAAGAGGYVYKAMDYRDAYMPHTVINGRDVSGKTAQEVKDLMSLGVKDYQLSLKLRGGGAEVISGGDIGLHTVFDGSLEEIIRQQNPYAWGRYVLKGPSYDINTMIALDEDTLETVLMGLDAFDGSKVTPPADAYLSEYISGQGYTVVPETEGNKPDLEKVKKGVLTGALSLSDQIDLDQMGCYLEPSIRRDNETLTAAMDSRNHYANMTVTYTFGSFSEVLGGDEIHKWFVIDGDKVSLDEENIKEYVKNLAQKYNTAYTKRSFKTSYGNMVDVSGFYGWRINQAAEVQELTRVLESGVSVAREPVYFQTAASHDGPDYGATYAEVNLTAQHMFFYKDGQKILESDFVSGNASRGYTTPPGLFGLTYKQRDAVLKGEGYASPVKFWMPFNGGIGFHDASWRSSFGGSIYKTSGSHGCLNMPYEAAKTLFENVYAGMPVICYNLAGTESTKTSNGSGKESPAKAPAQTTAQTPSAGLQGETPQQPEETQQPQPEGTQQPQPEGTPPPQPEVSIRPVEQTTPAPDRGTSDAETPAGYGPGFERGTAGGAADKEVTVYR